MIDFSELRRQVEEGLILEDEVELARLALLVPDLVEVLEARLPASAPLPEVLAQAKSLLRELSE